MKLDINVKREFIECICVKSNSDIFTVGYIYPICGTNNGMHVIGADSCGDPYDLLCFNYYLNDVYDNVIAPAEEGKEHDIVFIPISNDTYYDRLQAERILLGECLIDGKACKEIISELSSNDFKYKPHKIIFETFELLNREFMNIDLTTVTTVLLNRHKLEDVRGIEYLLQLAENVPTTCNTRHYIDYLKPKK